MSIGFICRFSRRNGINAWSWLFETLVCTVCSLCSLSGDTSTDAARLEES
jgi:hypothetical protein